MPNSQPSHFTVGCAILFAVCLIVPQTGCTSGSRNESDAIAQQLERQKTKTNNLRKAMRFLDQMNQLNRPEATKEVQLELNTWLKNTEKSGTGYSPPQLLASLPAEMLAVVGCKTPTELQFSYWDVDYLYECRMMNQLSSWIVDFPLRDTMVVHAIKQCEQELDTEDKIKLSEACKLFDWAMRNVALEPRGASVEETITDPAGPISDDGVGFEYLAWETLLFSTGDYIEKGRVFTTLARQRGINTAWISVGGAEGKGEIWAIAAQIGKSVYLFEPKLAMPILDPDTGALATLEETLTNARIMRRLDLPGQFDYALSMADLKDLQFLLDVPPTTGSVRMKLLEAALLGDERMVLYQDLVELEKAFNETAAGIPVAVWEIPLMAQVQAASVRERLNSISDFTLNYMAQHGVWLLDNPAANGRLNHLYGHFENTLDQQGALSMYMDSRIDEESIAKLEYDPETQRRLGVPRTQNEDKEQYLQRVRQMQFILRKSKSDAAFLMAQLHFDRGNYSAAENWFIKRVIDDENPLAKQWQAIGNYCLGRVYQELGDLDGAARQFTHQPSPMEAGMRLRLRYVRRMLELQEEPEGS